MSVPGTSARERRAVLDGTGPNKGEAALNTSIDPGGDFNEQGQTTADTPDDAASPLTLPDVIHDDYRGSKHYVRDRRYQNSGQVEGILRENSLARQLQAKRDQPAIIRLIRKRRADEREDQNTNERGVPWVNLIPPSTKFFLQVVQQSSEEKVQIIDTFGEWKAFFFGRRPEIYSYSGTLLNARNHNWKTDFQNSYDASLRGSQAVKNRAVCVLQYDDTIVEGFILNAKIQQSADNQHAVLFSFDMLIANRASIGATNLLGLREVTTKDLVNAMLTDLGKQVQELLENPLGPIEKLELEDSFLLMREFFGRKDFPAAGTMRKFDNTGDVDSSNASRPFAKAGLKDTEPESQTLRTTYTQRYQDVGETFIIPAVTF